ncbi:callose synthase 9 [Tanacetum coccineum]|uniref:1,3-beta-glucan synthase n=1 Tax=Tanacetum coccineum TaxID=301880 RepID=A0ABQ5BAW3_9ASTR
MSQVESLPEPLVHPVIGIGITEPDSTRPPADVVAGNVLSPRSNCRNIDPILRVAREFQEKNPHISLILCKHAYTLAQNLYPSTEARIMLQCIQDKMSVIQQNVANSEGARLLEFYTRYRENYNVDNLSEDGIRINLKVLGTVLELQYKTVSPPEANRLISEELRQKIESDAAMTVEVSAYNIIPLDDPATTNAITSFPEVRAAISSLKYHKGLPKLPYARDGADVLDFLQYVFGFQILDEAAVKKVFDKTFDNYTNWCAYVKEKPIWKDCQCSDEQSRLSPLDKENPEADVNKDGNAPYSTWRNYDDFNEYFWSRDCFEQLGWPLNKESSFFSKPSARSTSDPSVKSTGHGKTLFIERRTFLHLYHSFHRLWILLVMMFQGLVIIAWNDGKLNFKTRRGVLSVLDLVMMYGAHSTTGIIERFIWFMWATLSICFLYMIGLHVNTNSYLQLIIFVIYIMVLVIYAAIESYQSKLAFVLNWCKNSFVGRFPRQFPQEDCYVGRDLVEARTDYIKYMLFWLLVLGISFTFSYFILILPLVTSSRDIVLENMHMVLAIGSFWVVVFCVYLLAVHIIYTVISGVVAFLLGAWDFVGEIKSIDDVHKNFKSLPKAFMDNLHITIARRDSPMENAQVKDMEKENAARFSPFWNEIVNNLREEDYITNEEHNVLHMPQSSRSLLLVQWPLILLENKIQYAIVSVAECDSQEELWNRISRDVYMKHAVKECFCTVKLLLNSVLDGEGKLWQAEKEVETPELKTDAVRAAQDLYDVIMGDFLGVDMRDNHAMWKLFLDGRNEGRLFSKLNWPTGPELRSQIKRILSLLTFIKYQEYVPRNPEARRRLEYFTNSLFMSMPKPVAVPKILAFSVFTPYYKETVLYSKDELIKDIGQGTTLLVYLHHTYPDEWKNFLARMGLDESTSVSYFLENPDDKLILELRFWASYRGQTLARTVRGMMYNRQALILQSYMESVAVEEDSATETENFQFQCEAYADLKFTYVITCQLYSEQKKNQEPQAADIALLLQRNEALRVAFFDAVDMGHGQTKFFSKLVKGDINGNEKEVYSIELPGQFKLGEGKPENQNHAIVFTRGNAVQTIHMNQDNYFEETLKMRNLLQEFHKNHGIRPATILGVREYIYTERASSVASFMSKNETSLVTIAQRVLANPLKVRMHYGHPDVFDRVFHITRGGISKASRGINISEDIYAGYSQNSKAYIILNKHTMKIEESLNVTFDETPSPSKTSPLVDDDLDEEEAIKATEKKNLENDIENETLKIDNVDNPHRTLKNKGIIDSGCSRHMTGNKAYLADFQDFNGGPVAFGGSKGYITGKGKIKTGKLDFEDVSFVKELQPFNLFSVSQMCDKKNKVLFTDTECLVLSPDFKLPDENQILLKVPRQNNMYSFNLENIVPLGGLACLIAKATTDESNLWHRRLGHVNFKNLNRLVKGNLVRGLPTKLFHK